jgi:hypothetical protein
MLFQREKRMALYLILRRKQWRKILLLENSCQAKTTQNLTQSKTKPEILQLHVAKKDLQKHGRNTSSEPRELVFTYEFRLSL